MSAYGARKGAAARGDLAEDMLPVAANLAMLVHGEGSPRDIHQALARLDDAAKDALIVILAGLVDPDQTVASALKWLDFDEFGQKNAAAGSGQETIRELAEDVEPELDEHYVDWVAVEAYVRGQAVAVTKREQLEAIRAGVAQGMNYPDFDRLHGLAPGATSTFISRARKLYVEWGIEFPELSRPVAISVFSEEQVIEIRERCVGGATDMETAIAFGVTRSTITSVVSGESYARYGGPIRPKRENVPSEATRVLWAHTSAVVPELAAAG